MAQKEDNVLDQVTENKQDEGVVNLIGEDQHPIITENFLNLIMLIHKIVQLTLYLMIFPEIKNVHPTTSIQYCAGDDSQCNKI